LPGFYLYFLRFPSFSCFLFFTALSFFTVFVFGNVTKIADLPSILRWIISWRDFGSGRTASRLKSLLPDTVGSVHLNPGTR
jgi:hypothetical protein